MTMQGEAKGREERMKEEARRGLRIGHFFSSLLYIGACITAYLARGRHHQRFSAHGIHTVRNHLLLSIKTAFQSHNQGPIALQDLGLTVMTYTVNHLVVLVQQQ